MEEPAFQPIITLYDAITDSPVFRSSVTHYDEQLEHLEQWLDTLSRHLKLYTEKLNKLNLDTITVCQKAIPEGIDETLIDPHFTGAIMKSFSEALQTSLSFKAKFISNLEEALISPLQQFVKTHIKDFKNFRKQHEKSLEKYEAQLAKYSALHKTKEPSAIREEAFRLHEARKEYVRMSGQHVLRILNFRSLLEHCLVERFSAATLAHKGFYDDVQVWAKLEVALSYWKQWLMDDKSTCSYQLHKQQIARKRLEDEYFQLTAPDHDLETYIPTKAEEKPSSNFSKSKWGYLFLKTSRHSWTRKWGFIHNGYFGICQVDHTNKNKGSIVIENKVRVIDCEIQAATDVDRRFCFEITSTKSEQTPFILQAETESSMQEWIYMFETNKKDEKSKERSPNLRSNSKLGPANVISSAYATSLSDSPKLIKSDSSSSFANISSLSVNNTPVTSSTSLNQSKNTSEQGSSIVIVSTTPGAEPSLENSSSITPLLVYKAASGSYSQKILPSAAWGIPWSLVPTMTNLGYDNTSDIGNTVLPEVIWPAKPIAVDIPDVGINGYTDKMNAQNRELRRLFAGVKAEEVVLDVIGCCFRSKPTDINNITKDVESSKSSLNSTSADLYESELVNQLSQTGLTPTSDFGYSYTGRAFITQDTFWFYSSVLMSCINTVAIRLKDINEIKVFKDRSLTTVTSDSALAAKSDTAISFSILPDEKGNTREPLIFGTLMDDIETTAEKLRFAVSNAKSEEPMQIRNIFNKLQSLSANLASHKSLVLDLPNTFNDAVKPVEKNGNIGNVVISGPKRPHAATVGQESKVSTTSILRSSNRSRGDSEPLKSTAFADQAPKKPVVELPKPYVDPDVPPPHIQVPNGPIDCNCEDHLEKQDTQMILPISAKRCYELLFSNEQTAPPTNGGVWEEKTNAIDGHDLSVTKWAMTDGKMQRILKYWMPVSNPIVRMKEAEVVETQILINKEDYVRYTVQISTKTAALPYADAFIPSVRYCITWIDQSQCQLTCYLGVKWVKSVLVRAIVTRAALKGMSDSVGVFVPILQSAAENLKERLEGEKRAHNTKIQNGFDENVLKTSNVGMESVLEDSENEEENVKHTQEAEPLTDTIVPLSDNNEIKSVTPVASISTLTTSSTLDKAATKPIQPSERSVTKTNPQSNTVTPRHTATSVSKKSEGSAPAHSVSKRSKHNNTTHSTSWFTTVKDYAPLSIVSLGTIALFGFTVYMTVMWFKSGTKVINEANHYLQINASTSRPTPPVVKHHTHKRKSISRSVYLRDLNEGFLKNSLLPPYAGSKSYKLFLSNKNNQAKSLENGDISNNWYSVDHYRLAVDLDVSRERIAVLRHDMLTTFQVLNKVDSQMIENEYINWLLDTKLKCTYNPRLSEDDPRAEKSIALCSDIKRQLDRLF